ncbi:titin-like [Stigmatopora nigra]
MDHGHPPPTGLRLNKYQIPRLKEGQEYRIQVCALNKVGVGEPAVLPGTARAEERLEAPQIHLDSELRKGISVKAGGSFRIHVPFRGRPAPEVKWSKDQGTPTEKAVVEKGPTFTQLSVDSCDRCDSGKYTLTLSNGSGSATEAVAVKVLDTPGAPLNLAVKDVRKDSVTLVWEAPPNDGGSKVKSYVVDKRESTRKAYANVSAKCAKTTFKVENLTEGASYYFRVMAENEYGVGQAAETKTIEHRLSNLLAGNEYLLRVRAVNKYGTGDYLAGEPFAGQITKDSMLLSWAVPEQTGGADILGYHLEKRDRDGVRWTKCNRQKLTQTLFTATGLSARHFYEFRVAAENRAGVGEPSEPSLFYRACDATQPPGPPRHPKVTDYSKSSVSLSWSKPDSDGGAYVKGYVVEMRQYVPPPESPEEEVEVAPAVDAPAQKEWRVCTPPCGIQATRLTVADVTEGEEYQFRVCALNSEGVGEAAHVHGTVVAVDRLEAPEMELDADLRKVVSVRAGGTLRLFVAIRDRPQPAVKWQKVDGALAQRALIDSTGSYTMLVVDNVNRWDSGKYSLSLENAGGSKSAVVAVRVLDTPGAPQNLAVKELTKDSLTWDAPAADGGSKITNYVVEKRESIRKAYTTVASNCTANGFKIQELPEGGVFYFRVCAVNQYGQGPSAETEEVKVSQVPLPPANVALSDVTKSSVSLSWDKCAHDGGSKVICYYMEFKPKGGDKWGTACTVKATEATVPNLTAEQSYLFRVLAINEKGKSQPGELGLPVLVREAAIPPSVSPPFTAYSVKAGDDLTVEVPFGGRPKPAVSWKRDGLPVKQTTSLTVVNGASSSKIVLTKAGREHVGEYQITVANGAGTATSHLQLVVLDKPSPPTGVRVDAVTSDSISLSWSPPEYDGGCCVSNYVVQKRDTNTQDWQMAAGDVARTAYKAVRLVHGAEYQFRIYAVNRYGKSAHVDSPAITARYHFKQPGPPSTPAVKLATKSHMLVTWNEPVYDGGSPVLGYHLERKERASILWTKMNRGMIRDSEYKVGGVEEGAVYEYRVYAQNIAGIGKVSKASEPVAARDPCDPPGAPVVTSVGKSSVSLSWDKPQYDGGAKVSGYVVESRELPEGRWTRCNFTNVPETHYRVTGLTENAQYHFRVVAKYAAGLLSPPSDHTGPVAVKDDVELPRIVMDVKYRETVSVKAGETLKIRADVAGRPAPVLAWCKDGGELLPRARIQILSTDTATSVTVKDCVRGDSGRYVLTLQNIAGKVSTPIHCVVLDKPGPPAGPLQVTDLTAQGCTLSWGPPQEAGGADITRYVLEKHETSRLAWTLMKDDVTKTYHAVTGLLKGNEYVFRVSAVNKHGIGETLESHAVKVADPYSPAGAPLDVDVTDVAGDSMRLTAMRWIRVNRDLIAVCHASVTKLRRGCEYDFRVYAENAAGLSPPSELSASFRALAPLTGPAAPSKPKIVHSTRDSVSIVWKAPADIGGAPVLGYAVEYRDYVGKLAKEGEGYEEEEEEEEEPQRWLEAMALTKSLEMTVTGLKNAAQYEFCVKAINKMGSSVRSRRSDAAAATERTAPPTFDVDVETRKVLVVKRGLAFTLKVPFKGQPVPSAVWSKEGTELKARGTAEASDSDASLTIENSGRNDSGEYRLTIASDLGEATIPLSVKVLDSPGPPLNVKVSAVTRDSAALTWEAPDNDGGDAVKAYHVEKREASKKAWVSVTTNCHAPACKVEDLLEGAVYYFRVMGENEYGVGVPQEVKAGTKITEVPSPPAKLGVADVTRDSVTIAWTRPEYDGGSRVKAYLLDALEKGQTKWVKCATVKTTSHSVKSLREGAEYFFRVRAENHAGLSEAKEMIAPVLVKEILEAPEFDLKNYPKNTVYVRAGSDLTFDIPLSGKPMPKVSVSKNNVPVKGSKRLSARVTPDSLSVSLEQSVAGDAGKYQLSASNAGGASQISVNVVVLDRPGPPLGPVEILEVGETTAHLKWTPPEYDGGSPVTNYVLLKRETSTPTWTEVSANVARSQIRATKLTRGEEYQFRVRAQNRYGLSEHLDSKPVTIRLPFVAPGPPSTPWVSFVCRDNLTVCWNEPVNDGGNAVTGYHLHMKERSSILWQKINKSAIAGNQMRVSNICPGLIYEFKVTPGWAK